MTHELGSGRRAADRAVFMDQGEIVHHAPVEEFFSASAPERVGRFLTGMAASGTKERPTKSMAKP